MSANIPYGITLLKTISFIFTAALVLLHLSLSWAAVTTKAGTITLVIGKATVERGTPAEVTPVNFRDPVYLKDSITTGEESFVRVLMGRKALVTVSEMSVLTITEDLHQATINLDSGFIGLSVARKRMDNGEYIEIRTPHAVAAVRGTKVIAEVPRPDITRITVVEGHVDVYSHSAPSQVVSVSTRQSISASRMAPSRIETLTRKVIEEKKQRLTPPKPPAADSSTSDIMVEKQIGDATKIAKGMIGPSYSNQQSGTAGKSGNTAVASQSGSGESGTSSSGGSAVAVGGSTGGGTPTGGPVASSGSVPSSPAPTPAPTPLAPKAPAPAPLAPKAPAPAPMPRIVVSTPKTSHKPTSFLIFKRSFGGKWSTFSKAKKTELRNAYHNQ